MVVSIGLNSVVVTSSDDLLAGRPKDQGVLVLRRVAAFDVTQGRVGVDDAVVAKVLKCHQVLRLPQPVHPSPAEGQGAEILLDDVEQMLGLLQSSRVEMKASNIKRLRYENNKSKCKFVWYIVYSVYGQQEKDSAR